MEAIKIGTAGWSIPRQSAAAFPEEGSSLERYASRLSVVEINSSFYRSHRHSTWTRWRDSTPPGFRFSVKMPKSVTHHHRLVDCDELVAAFLVQVQALDEKLAVLLVQLPPRLEYNQHVADRFFAALRSGTSAMVACEPRHSSWFLPDADALLTRHEVARVAADPSICPAAARPGGWLGLSYWRLHGSPTMYRSSYADRLTSYADLIRERLTVESQSWCIFDNTASGAAIHDALALANALRT